MNDVNQCLSWGDFTNVDMRVGTIVSAEHFLEAKNPSVKLTIDFGDLGIKKSSAQITKLYHPESLVGRQIIAVVNFPPKQIANMMSECLVLGAVAEQNSVTLLTTDFPVQNGLRVG